MGIPTLDANFEGLMKKSLLFAMICCFAMQSSAQQVIISNLPRPSGAMSNNRVIGDNKGGIYVLRYRDIDIKRHISLDRYSHNLDLLEEQNIAFKNKQKLIRIFTRDSGLVYIQHTGPEKSIDVQAVFFGFSLKKDPEIIKLGGGFRAESEDGIAADYSQNREWCSVWIEEEAENGNQRIRNILFNIPENKTYSTVQNLQFNHRDMRIAQTAVSNSGLSSCIVEFNDDSKRKSDPASKQYFACTFSSNSTSEPFALGAGKFFISGIELVCDEFSGKFTTCGFYDFKNSEAAHGVFRVNYNLFQQDEAIMTPINRKTVADIIGNANEEAGKEPEHFYVRKLIPRSDGGLLMVSENFQISQQLETFFLNGIPQTSSKNVYNYNDVLFLALDSAGNNEWNYLLHKRQSSFASSNHYNSIATFVCDSFVHLLYNDNISQNNRVMYVSLGRSGKMLQKVLFSSENAYTAVIPSEGKQTGFNRFVVPLVTDKQTYFLKVRESDTP